MVDRIFKLQENSTTIQQEVFAGITTFFTAAHVIVINPTILTGAGIPFSYALLATILTTVIGCFLTGLWANVPLMLAPGMGVNAFFVYTIVQGYGLSWESGLAVVLVAGFLLTVIAFTPIATILAKAVPPALKNGITAGIGLFLMMIGLQMGGVIIGEEGSLVTLAPLDSLELIYTLLGLLILLILYVRRVRGAFMIGLILTTVIIYLSGGPVSKAAEAIDFSGYTGIFTTADFSAAWELPFWMAVFSLTILVLFDTFGLTNGLIPHSSRAGHVFKSNGITAFISGLLGTSPSIPVAESAAGMAEGGRTGLTTVTAGILFFVSLLFIPLLSGVPHAAIAPILIMLGLLMSQAIKDVPGDFTEWFPAILTAVLMPFTYSIINGLAAGFILYPLLKLAVGKGSEVNPYQYLIALLFILNYLLLII